MRICLFILLFLVSSSGADPSESMNEALAIQYLLQGAGISQNNHVMLEAMTKELLADHAFLEMLLRDANSNHPWFAILKNIQHAQNILDEAKKHDKPYLYIYDESTLLEKIHENELYFKNHSAHFPSASYVFHNLEIETELALKNPKYPVEKLMGIEQFLRIKNNHEATEQYHQIAERLNQALLEKPEKFALFPYSELQQYYQQPEFAKKIKLLNADQRADFYIHSFSNQDQWKSDVQNYHDIPAPVHSFEEHLAELAKAPHENFDEITALFKRFPLGFQDRFADDRFGGWMEEISTSAALKEEEKKSLHDLALKFPFHDRIAVEAMIRDLPEIHKLSGLARAVEDPSSHFRIHYPTLTVEDVYNKISEKIEIDLGPLPNDSFSKMFKRVVKAQLKQLEIGNLTVNRGVSRYRHNSWIGGDLFYKLKEADPKFAHRYTDAYFRNEFFTAFLGGKKPLNESEVLDEFEYPFRPNSLVEDKLFEYYKNTPGSKDILKSVYRLAEEVATDPSKTKIILKYFPKESSAYAGAKFIELSKLDQSYFHLYTHNSEFRNSIHTYLETISKNPKLLARVLKNCPELRGLLKEVPLHDLVILGSKEAREIYHSLYTILPTDLTDHRTPISKVIEQIQFRNHLFSDIAAVHGVNRKEINFYAESTQILLDALEERVKEKNPPNAIDLALVLEEKEHFRAATARGHRDQGEFPERGPMIEQVDQSHCWQEFYLKVLRPALVNLN